MGGWAKLVGRADALDRCSAAISDERFRCLVLRGPMGVGKTRLAREVEALTARRGAACRVIQATASGREIPLSAMAALVPPLGADVNPLGAALAALRDRPEGVGQLLLVDDAQWLDDASAALIHQIVTTGESFGLLTVRGGEEVPAAVASLLRRPDVMTLDLDPLTAPAVAEMVSEILPGDVTTELIQRVVALSEGNPLIVNELVAGGLASGDIAEVDHRWQEVGSLERSPRVAEMVAARVGRLDEPTRRALGLVAVADPLPLAWVTDADTRRFLDLEAAGLVTVVSEGGRDVLRVTHPLYGEALRAGLSSLQRRAVLLDLVAAARAAPDDERDVLAVALWALELELPTAASDLRAAARRAFAVHRFDLAVTFLDAVPTDDRDARHRHELMNARFHADDLAGGQELLDVMYQNPEDDQELASAAEHLILHAQLGGDIELARRVSADALARIGDADARSTVELAALATDVLDASSGDVTAAVMPIFDAGHRDVQVRTAAPLVAGLVVQGRVREAVEVARRGNEQTQELWFEHGPDGTVTHPASGTLLAVYALATEGDLEAAMALLTEADARFDGMSSRLAQADLALAHAVVAYRAGRLADVAVHARLALDAYGATAHHRGPRWTLAAGHLLLSAARRGDGALVAEAGVLLDQARGGRITDGFVALCQAWSVVAVGSLTDARRRLVDLIESTVEADDGLYATEAAWALVAVGAASQVPDGLLAATSRIDGRLVEAWRDAAGAARGRDPEALETMTERFEVLGATADAAEAAAAAVPLWAEIGEARRATAAARRARRLAKRCQGLSTPAMVLPDPRAKLSAREREIAGLAALGTPAKEMAERFVLSQRTVTNHLQRIYDKLGVSSRAELAAALDGDC